MLLRVLGPLEVMGDDGPVALGGAKPRALLASLAIHRATTCTSDALIDALWGEAPPASAPKLLQVYVSQLRKALPTGPQIVTGSTGYTLEVDAAAIDAVVFERLVNDGRAALRAGNPALAASTLARGLALGSSTASRWRRDLRSPLQRGSGLRYRVAASCRSASATRAAHAPPMATGRALGSSGTA